MIARIYAQLSTFWKPKKNPKRRRQQGEASEEQEEEEEVGASPEGAARSESVASLETEGMDKDEESRMAEQLGFPASPEAPEESLKTGLSDEFAQLAIHSGKKASKPDVVEISDSPVKSPQPPVKKGITVDATRVQQLRWLQCLS